MYAVAVQGRRSQAHRDTLHDKERDTTESNRKPRDALLVCENCLLLAHLVQLQPPNGTHLFDCES